MQRPVGYASGVPNATVCAFTQVKRIMKINDLTPVTADVIDTAASTLVIGTT